MFIRCRRKAPSSAAGSPGQVQPDSRSNAVRFCRLQHDGSVLRIHVGRKLEVPAGRRLPAPGLGPRPDMVDQFRARRSSVAVQVGLQAGQPPARYRVKMPPPPSSHASRRGSAAKPTCALRRPPKPALRRAPRASHEPMSVAAGDIADPDRICIERDESAFRPGPVTCRMSLQRVRARSSLP